MRKLANLKRPQETLTGLSLAAAVYGFLTQAAVSEPLAALVALAVAFVPVMVSGIVDALRAR